MRAHALALVLTLALAPAALAQPTVTVAGAVGVPQGEFDDALGAVGGGLSVTALYRVPGSAVGVGVEGTALLYGYERRRVPFSLTVPDVAVDVTTANSLAQGLAVVRLQVPAGAVRPYLDGLAGVQYLWTETSVGDDYDGYVLASTTNFDDLAFVYGGGFGVQARLGSLHDDDGRARTVLLDARVRYLAGTEADYLAAGDIERYRDGTIELFPRRSRTSLLIPQLGVTVEL